MVVMVTGHRPERLYGQEEDVRLWLAAKIKELKPDSCISGMAKGVDIIFAKEVIKAGLPLDCYYPYMKPVDKYTQEQIEINKAAHSIVFTDLEYSKKCFIIRDRAMVDDSDVVLVVWDGIAAGGTYFTMEYAKKKGKQVIVYMIQKEDEKYDNGID